MLICKVYLLPIGALVGFVNLGEINTHLVKYENSLLQETGSMGTLANSMMVFMVKGLFSRLQFPYVQFPCTAVSGDLLFDPFWEAVRRLERSGFRVLGVTCDGLAANRRFIKLHHADGSSGLVYKTSNPYAQERRDLFFFSDPPHLLKTTRNCWASKNRTLWVSIY